MGLLSLNRFQEALSTLLSEIEENTKKKGAGYTHYLDYFYLGIIYYELNDYKSTITYFDKSLEKYPNFSDVQYWKALSLFHLENMMKG